MNHETPLSYDVGLSRSCDFEDCSCHFSLGRDVISCWGAGLVVRNAGKSLLGSILLAVLVGQSPADMSSNSIPPHFFKIMGYALKQGLKYHVGSAPIL